MDEATKQGHYARKQICCPSRLIAWSHRRRFATGLAFTRDLASKTLLDYGSGDGTFLAMLMDSPQAPKLAVGAELEERLVAECRQRLGQRAGLQFSTVRSLEGAEHAGRYEVVICMEVLEHVVEVEPLLNDFDRLLAPAGRLIISVPVEIGLPLIVKQVARRIAGWRGLGDYPGTSSYSLAELWASVIAGQRQHITRPLHRQPDGSAFYDHKGFNWRLLRERIGQRFKLLQTVASPLTWLPPGWGSQVWLVANKRQ